MQNIVLLGATGAIGTQVLEIVQRYPDQFQVVGMSANSNQRKLEKFCARFNCDRFYLHEGNNSKRIANIDELIFGEVAHVIVADHGLNSYSAVLKALTMGIRASIANKELLICHGEDIVYLAGEQQADLIPLDSEHNALWQCFKGEKMTDVRRLIITASGGSFRDFDPEMLKAVTIDQVLNHPNWTMGNKTTVDSATLVNKAFEVIEAHILFGIPYDRIEVRIHPESIIHAIVEFTDGTSKMLGYQPDMRFALGSALFYPDRAEESLGSNQEYFDYDQDLHFEKLETGRFPCFDLVMDKARYRPECLRTLVENDQRAVTMFLGNQIKFSEIYDYL